MQNSSTKYQQTNSEIHKRNNIPRSSWVYPRNVRLVQCSKAIRVTHHMVSLKKKSHMIVSIDSEKEFEKMWYPFLKKLSAIEIEINWPTLIKGIYKKKKKNPTVNIRVTAERLNTLPLWLGARKEFHLTTFNQHRVRSPSQHNKARKVGEGAGYRPESKK